MNFILNRRDLDRFEAFFWTSDEVVALSQPTPAADLVIANSLRPEAENQLRPWPSMFLARAADLDLIRVHLVEQQGYYLIDFLRSPVIEWSPGYDPTGHRSGRGRLWFPTGYWDDDDEFVQMPSGFLDVTVAVRWIPLVPAAYGTRVARPARTTMLAPDDLSQLRSAPPRCGGSPPSARSRGGALVEAAGPLLAVPTNPAQQPVAPSEEAAGLAARL